MKRCEERGNFSPFDQWLELSKETNLDWKKYKRTAGKMSTFAKTICSLTGDNDNFEISRLVDNIFNCLQDPSNKNKMGHILYNRTVTSDTMGNAFSKAVHEVGKRLLKCSNPKAQKCASWIQNLLEFPFDGVRPPLPNEIEDIIFSKFDLSELRVLGIVSHAERMRVLPILSKKINKGKIPFSKIGFKSLKAVANFWGPFSTMLTYLDFTGLNLQGLGKCSLKELSNIFPQATHLIIQNNEFLHASHLRSFKGMPLTYVNLSCCRNLKNNALKYLKEMPLTYVDFSFCHFLTDKGLAYLEGIPLTHADFSCCPQLTDDGVGRLKGMPLTFVDLSYCFGLTNKAMEHLEKMPLESIKFRRVLNLTDDAFSHLKGMPLKELDFSGCSHLTDKAFVFLEEMHLKSIDFSHCDEITDAAFSYLKGMLLKSINFNYCTQLTDQVLLNLEGMPLFYVYFQGCSQMKIGRSLCIQYGKPFDLQALLRTQDNSKTGFPAQH